MDWQDKEHEDTELQPGANATGAVRWSPPPPDIEKYKGDLDEFDLSDEDKAELIRALWSILAGFVDLGFGTAPVQAVLQPLLTLGQGDESAADESSRNLQDQFDLCTNKITNDTEDLDESN